MGTTYDVIVIGGGHSGCEAALAAARMGVRTLMLNLYLDNTALMPCNPSIGGPAKGHLVREGSALGGEQARAADASTMLIRWLNTSKGPAVRALRAQCDLNDYRDHYVRVLEAAPNLDVHQDTVTDLVIADGRIRGVRTLYGLSYEAKAVVITTGTYLRSLVHVGFTSFPSGPMGQNRSTELSKSMEAAGIVLERIRTDTTPRLHADTIDYDSLEEQKSDPEPLCFDLWGEGRVYEGYSCALTRSTPETHAVIRANLERSPLYKGKMEGLGPRYCPSIEDKVIRFPQKESHPIFLEPVSRRNREVYVQNFSTSLPYDVQVEMVHTLPGCGHAHLTRAGYAIEYDYVPPTQLLPTLETKSVKGLYCAGQINGTSGYEEAGAQGLMGGINAALAVRGEEPLVLRRDEAYIGVLIDDLVTKGTNEPYRMLTSRCEHRLLLRHDNADRRLAPVGRRLGLIDDDRWNALLKRWEKRDREAERLRSVKLTASDALNDRLREAGTAPLAESVTAAELLKRPEVTYELVAAFVPPESPLDGEDVRCVETEIKYAGYIGRQQRAAAQLSRMDHAKIPDDFDYASVPGLLAESRQKLERVRPLTLGQAGRISGVTPADIQLLSIVLETRRRREAATGNTSGRNGATSPDGR